MAGYSDYRDQIVNEFIAILMDGVARHVNAISLCTGENIGLTYEQLILPYQGNNASESRTEWQYQNAWVAMELKRRGMVDNPERGYYRITPLGKALFESGIPITMQSMKDFAGNQED